MAYNMYKQIPKLKEALKIRGYENNIPWDIFIKTMMLMLGMKRKTAVLWIREFDEMALIKINNVDDSINFV